jgi:hypothetical protein
MPAVVTPSVHVTDMACVGHVFHTIAFPKLCGITPTFVLYCECVLRVAHSRADPRQLSSKLGAVLALIRLFTRNPRSTKTATGVLSTLLCRATISTETKHLSSYACSQI